MGEEVDPSPSMTGVLIRGHLDRTQEGRSVKTGRTLPEAGRGREGTLP